MKFPDARKLFLISLCFPFTISAVYEIHARQSSLSPEAAKNRLFQRAKRENYGFEAMDYDPFPDLDKTDSKYRTSTSKPVEGIITLAATKAANFSILVGNISIGTSPQMFSVEVDYFWGSELVVLGSSVDTSGWDTKFAVYPPWHTFNESASSSYTRLSANFSFEFEDYSDYHEFVYTIGGHVGTDVVHLSGLNFTNVSFAVIDDVPSASEDVYFPTDATLGLVDEIPYYGENSSACFVKQISSQLDRPIVCLWSNKSFTNVSEGNAQITIGATDSKHCESDWVYVPQLPNRTFVTNATLVEAIAANGTVLAFVRIKGTVNLRSHITYPMVPNSVYNLFVNASGASWNPYVGRHIVCNYRTCEDCNIDLNQLGIVRVRVDDKTRDRIIFTPADYVGNYDSLYLQRNVCVIAAGVWSENRSPQEKTSILLGEKYFNNHCTSVNIRTREIGFATAKKQNSEGQTTAITQKTAGQTGGVSRTAVPSGTYAETKRYTTSKQTSRVTQRTAASSRKSSTNRYSTISSQTNAASHHSSISSQTRQSRSQTQHTVISSRTNPETRHTQISDQRSQNSKRTTIPYQSSAALHSSVPQHSTIHHQSSSVNQHTTVRSRTNPDTKPTQSSGRTSRVTRVTARSSQTKSRTTRRSSTSNARSTSKRRFLEEV